MGSGFSVGWFNQAGLPWLEARVAVGNAEFLTHPNGKVLTHPWQVKVLVLRGTLTPPRFEFVASARSCEAVFLLPPG